MLTLIKRCLKQLRFTAFVLEDNFYDVTQKAVITPEDNVTILAKLKTISEQNYSVSTMSKQLRELADQHGEELLERRYDAWPRLLAAFRAVYGGVNHDDVHIPAYGGNLFNPDRFPFFESRKLGITWKKAEPTFTQLANQLIWTDPVGWFEHREPPWQQKGKRGSPVEAEAAEL